MAMNKKEQAALAELEKERDMARALSWPNFPKPEPVHLSDLDYDQYKHGYVIFGWDSFRLEERWSSTNFNYPFDPKQRGLRTGCGSQGGCRMYATPKEAWLAFYHERARGCAELLARILKAAEEAKESEK